MGWPFLLAFGLAVVASFFGRGWVLRHHRDGKLSGRRAGWIYAGVIAAPYLAISAYLIVQDPGAIWFALLIPALLLPVLIVPGIAAFRYPEDERRKRQR